jgi:hypothetical protein
MYNTMGTNYVVPQASPFLINGVSSIVPDENIFVNRGTGNVTVSVASSNSYVSSIEGISGAVQFRGVGNVVGTQLNQLYFVPYVQNIIGVGKAPVSVSGQAFTINFT